MRQKRNGMGVCAATGPCNPRATHADGPLTERRLRVQVALAQPDAGCLVSAAILGGACFVVLYEISPCWVPEEMDCGRFPGRCARTQCSNRRVRALSGLRFHTCPQLIRFAVKSTESYLWLPCGRIEAHQSTALTAWGCWVLRWVPGRPEWPPGAYLRGGTPASEISNLALAQETRHPVARLLERARHLQGLELGFPPRDDVLGGGVLACGTVHTSP